MMTRVLVVSLAERLEWAAEVVGLLGSGCEVTVLRGADRQKFELALNAAQYQVVHLIGDGMVSAVQAGDGWLPESELITLLEGQTGLEFVMLAMCDSFTTAARVHNALHVPVAAYDGAIADAAAGEFTRSFYRHWRRSRDVAAAVERARESVMALYGEQAARVRLINGDMITPGRFSACIDEVTVRLGEVTAGIGELRERVGRVEELVARPSNNWVVWALLGLLLVAQVGTAWWVGR